MGSPQVLIMAQDRYEQINVILLSATKTMFI